MLRKLVLVTLLSLAIVACSKEPKTVDYYLQHEQERTALLEKANSNPGKYLNDSDVINAEAARRRFMMRDWSKKGTRVVNPELGKLH